MNESLAHFQSVCRTSFEFLVSAFGFRELPEERDDSYVVRFTNGEVVLRVIGEGWGTVARVEYKTSDGRAVPESVLEPDWKPVARKGKSKLSRGCNITQDEQIQAAAARIRARDKGILLGDSTRLLEAASRWQSLMARFRNDA